MHKKPGGQCPPGSAISPKSRVGTAERISFEYLALSGEILSVYALSGGKVVVR